MVMMWIEGVVYHVRHGAEMAIYSKSNLNKGLKKIDIFQKKFML
jgi:hypothetical protein